MTNAGKTNYPIQMGKYIIFFFLISFRDIAQDNNVCLKSFRQIGCYINSKKYESNEFERNDCKKLSNFFITIVKLFKKGVDIDIHLIVESGNKKSATSPVDDIDFEQEEFTLRKNCQSSHFQHFSYTSKNTLNDLLTFLTLVLHNLKKENTSYCNICTSFTSFQKLADFSKGMYISDESIDYNLFRHNFGYVENNILWAIRKTLFGPYNQLLSWNQIYFNWAVASWWIGHYIYSNIGIYYEKEMIALLFSNLAILFPIQANKMESSIIWMIVNESGRSRRRRRKKLSEDNHHHSEPYMKRNSGTENMRRKVMSVYFILPKKTIPKINTFSNFMLQISRKQKFRGQSRALFMEDYNYDSNRDFAFDKFFNFLHMKLNLQNIAFRNRESRQVSNIVSDPNFNTSFAGNERDDDNDDESGNYEKIEDFCHKFETDQNCKISAICVTPTLEYNFINDFIEDVYIKINNQKLGDSVNIFELLLDGDEEIINFIRGENSPQFSRRKEEEEGGNENIGSIYWWLPADLQLFFFFGEGLKEAILRTIKLIKIVDFISNLIIYNETKKKIQNNYVQNLFEKIKFKTFVYSFENCKSFKTKERKNWTLKFENNNSIKNQEHFSEFAFIKNENEYTVSRQSPKIIPYTITDFGVLLNYYVSHTDEFLNREASLLMEKPTNRMSALLVAIYTNIIKTGINLYALKEVKLRGTISSNSSRGTDVPLKWIISNEYVYYEPNGIIIPSNTVSSKQYES